MSDILLKVMGHSPPELIRNHDAFVSQLKRTQTERGYIDEIDGVRVEVEVFLTDRKHERCHVRLGEERLGLAVELTSIPWNPLKPMTVSYWFWLSEHSEKRAKALLRDAGVEAEVFQDWYAEPAIYHASPGSMEDVVKLFKHLQTIQHPVLGILRKENKEAA